MNESKPIASLSPTLLARKGGAKPAMRPQMQPLHQFHEATARQMDLEGDLGWNDLGEDLDHEQEYVGPGAEVFQLNPAMPAGSGVPEVVQLQGRLSDRMVSPAKPRRPALADGRRAAFTLRLDADRHLKLRLACTIDNRSAQQLVIDALDQFLAELPEVATLAAQVRKRS